MQHILQNIEKNQDSNNIEFLIDLVNTLRPLKKDAPEQATHNVQLLTQQLIDHPPLATALRHYILNIVSHRQQTRIYTDVGILSSDGFFTELYRRLINKVIPTALNDKDFADTLELILPHRTDYIWIQSISNTTWNQLLQVLKNAPYDINTDVLHDAEKKTLMEVLQAIQVLSYRISNSGLEPEFVNAYSDNNALTSPFVTQNVELHLYLSQFIRYLNNQTDRIESTAAILTLLNQCKVIIKRIRQNTLKQGTSIALTYRLIRLKQHINRLCTLLIFIEKYTQSDQGQQPSSDIPCVEFALDLIKQHNNKSNIRSFFRENINLLARNITENASKTGEHYIAENRKEYTAMYWSAAGGGIIVGCMAMLKVFASFLHSPPLIEGMLYSLIYALGFVLIYILHLTVATKQPAMTASRIAASIHYSGQQHYIYQKSLIDLIIKVFRTQFIAVIGNLSIAFPTAYLLALGYVHLIGKHLVSPEKAASMIHDLNPVTTLSVFYGAIAGVCLFLAGLISGYYDNKALYTKMSARIVRTRWINRLLGKTRTQRFGNYIESSLGGLMGNFFFGFLLGLIPVLGFMTGLPLDIRHITFASANFAIAFVGLDGNVSMHVIMVTIIGILLIGMANLLVSFLLALFVALRSRRVKLVHTGLLFKGLLKHLIRRPLDFIRPPKHPKNNA